MFLHRCYFACYQRKNAIESLQFCTMKETSSFQILKRHNQIQQVKSGLNPTHREIENGTLDTNYPVAHCHRRIMVETYH